MAQGTALCRKQLFLLLTNEVTRVHAAQRQVSVVWAAELNTAFWLVEMSSSQHGKSTLFFD